MCCITPNIAAKVFGSKGVKLTLGKSGDPNLWPYEGSLEAAASFGANVVEAEVSEVIIDSDHKIVTSPAFMYNGKFHEIQDSVSNMVKLMKKHDWIFFLLQYSFDLSTFNLIKIFDLSNIFIVPKILIVKYLIY